MQSVCDSDQLQLKAISKVNVNIRYGFVEIKDVIPMGNSHGLYSDWLVMKIETSTLY